LNRNVLNRKVVYSAKVENKDVHHDSQYIGSKNSWAKHEFLELPRHSNCCKSPLDWKATLRNSRRFWKEILERFWKDLEKIWKDLERFGKDLERILERFGKIWKDLERFGKILERFGKDFGKIVERFWKDKQISLPLSFANCGTCYKF
jgi:hypothetical protein